jgi:hypothetical protein
MPYITKADRKKLTFRDDKFPETSGELNYLITQLANQYLKYKGLSYTTLNEIMGVFTCASVEFYRRVVVPYEDKKKENNGDVFGA